MPEPITVYLSHFRTVSEKNLHQHWRKRAQRTRVQRETVFRSLQALLGLQCPYALPLTVTLTRIAPRPLDAGDNLAMSVSACRDAVADYLCGVYGAGDDRQPGISWQYDQRRGKKNEYALEITMTPAYED